MYSKLNNLHISGVSFFIFIKKCPFLRFKNLYMKLKEMKEDEKLFRKKKLNGVNWQHKS